MSFFLVGSSDHPQTRSGVSRCTQTASAASDSCSHQSVVHSKNNPPRTTPVSTSSCSAHSIYVHASFFHIKTPCVWLFVTVKHRSVSVQAPGIPDEVDAEKLSFHSSHGLLPCLRCISRQQARAEGKEFFGVFLPWTCFTSGTSDTCFKSSSCLDFSLISWQEWSSHWLLPLRWRNTLRSFSLCKFWLSSEILKIFFHTTDPRSVKSQWSGIIWGVNQAVLSFPDCHRFVCANTNTCHQAAEPVERCTAAAAPLPLQHVCPLPLLWVSSPLDRPARCSCPGLSRSHISSHPTLLFRLCSSPLRASPGNKQDATAGFRSQKESKSRRKHSSSAGGQSSLDCSLNKAIRAAKRMESMSGHMSRSLRTGLHHQQLLLTPLMAQLSQRQTWSWRPR